MPLGDGRFVLAGDPDFRNQLVACTLDCYMNIVELAESIPTLSTLVAALMAGDPELELSQPGP